MYPRRAEFDSRSLDGLHATLSWRRQRSVLATVLMSASFVQARSAILQIVLDPWIANSFAGSVVPEDWRNLTLLRRPRPVPLRSPGQTQSQGRLRPVSALFV